MQGCYLIHFATPYKHARHYIGFSTDITARLGEHTRGSGARLMAVINAAGIAWQLARVWEGKDRTFERKLHNWHGASKMCPLCRK